MIFVAMNRSAPRQSRTWSVARETIDKVLVDLVAEYDGRNSGLQLRKSPRLADCHAAEHHEQFVPTEVKTERKLSLASLETLAVIAYKQPVTVRRF